MRGTYKTTNKAQDTTEEETDCGKNLAEGLRQETPERVELILGMRHTLNLSLGIVNGLRDITSELKRMKC